MIHCNFILGLQPRISENMLTTFLFGYHYISFKDKYKNINHFSLVIATLSVILYLKERQQ